MGFSSYWFDEKFQELPLMFYFSKTKALDLTKSCVNIVPAGLKGVDEIRLRDAPFAVAPDFEGRVVYEWGCGCRSTISDDDLKKAKVAYKKNQKFCETPHTWAGNFPHTNYYNLPPNMSFLRLGNRTFLDLRKANVSLTRREAHISGIKAILLPTDPGTKAMRLLRRIEVEAQRQRS